MITKLVDGKKLKKWIDCPVLTGTEVRSKKYIYDGIEKCTLSPAELADENLKALAVLGGLKEYLRGKVDPHLVGIRNLIRNLESDVSGKERSKK